MADCCSCRAGWKTGGGLPPARIWTSRSWTPPSNLSTLVVPARGDGFGWDPIFEPTDGECRRGGFDGGRTYAEMPKGEKDAISHRSRAFARFRSYLAKDA